MSDSPSTGAAGGAAGKDAEEPAAVSRKRNFAVDGAGGAAASPVKDQKPENPENDEDAYSDSSRGARRSGTEEH